jgi:predicted ester cyclase
MPADPSTVFLRIVDEVLNDGRLDLLDHAGSEGREGYRETISFVRGIFPDMHVTVHELIPGPDRVAARFTVEATHQGEFMGIPATGKRVSWEGIGIIRVEEGKMVERWNVSDMLGLIEQIKGE